MVGQAQSLLPTNGAANECFALVLWICKSHAAIRQILERAFTRDLCNPDQFLACVQGPNDYCLISGRIFRGAFPAGIWIN